jgi:hypothetical protein
MNHELLALIEHEVLGWPGVVKESGSFDTAIYRLRRREIGHIHQDGVADLPFPKAVYDTLIADKRAKPHRAGFAGYVSYQIDSLDTAREAIALFRMNYERAQSIVKRHAARFEETEQAM